MSRPLKPVEIRASPWARRRRAWRIPPNVAWALGVVAVCLLWSAVILATATRFHPS